MSFEQNPENSPDTNRQARKKLVLLNDQREKLESLLSQLPLREATILRLLYGFEDGYRHNFYEVGHIIGVAGELIRQLEGRAFSQLGKNALYFTELEYAIENPPDTESGAI